MFTLEDAAMVRLQRAASEEHNEDAGQECRELFNNLYVSRLFDILVVLRHGIDQMWWSTGRITPEFKSFFFDLEKVMPDVSWVFQNVPYGKEQQLVAQVTGITSALLQRMRRIYLDGLKEWQVSSCPVLVDAGRGLAALCDDMKKLCSEMEKSSADIRDQNTEAEEKKTDGSTPC